MIFTVTLNPAVDKILFLDSLQRSGTNRLERTLETIGGKGTHVFVGVKLLGLPCTALGIAIGETGRKIVRLLDAWGEGASFLCYDLPGLESRTNYQIVETSNHVSTMLPERGPLLPRWMTDALLTQIRAMIKPGDILALAGDASNVEDTSIYGELAAAAQGLGARVALDASGPHLLEGLKARPFLIKPNLEELCAVVGKELSSDEQILRALDELECFQIPMVAVTRGGEGAILRAGSAVYRSEPNDVETRNAGGCGDAFLAGMLAGLERGLAAVDTLKLASGAAAAAAECESTVGFDPARADQLTQQVVIRRLR